MANITYVGTATSANRGIATSEASFNITSFNQTYNDEKDYFLDEDETPIGFWCGHKKNVTVSVEGEITTSLTAIPVQLAEVGTVTLANLISGYGITTGGLYMDDFSISLQRGAINSFTFNATQYPNIA